MTALSAALGWAAPALISKTYTHYLAVALFFFFGLRSLYESLLAWEGGGMQEELEETEKELGAKGKKKGKTKTKTSAFLSSTLVETFVITFLAEWGDRSQIATIGLAASEDPFGVTLGGVLGHAVCTGAAVLGGKHMATLVSERAVAITGGALFVLFGTHALVTGVEE
jgi:putative Ca2+/H+ antiporter (TMEM165/GDT1 family)